MAKLKAPFVTRIKGGGVLTYQGSRSGIAVYWGVLAQDPRIGEGPWPPVGEFKYERTVTRADRCATNVYYAPDHTPVIRVGMHYKVGEVKVGQPSGLWDRASVTLVED